MNIKNIIDKGKKAVESGVKNSKELYELSKKRANSEVHKQRKSIALSVIDEAKNKVNKTDKKQLKKASKIVKNKFEKGGEVENNSFGWAKKYLDDTNEYKKLSWYIMMGKGNEITKNKIDYIYFEDGSGLMYDKNKHEWVNHNTKIKLVKGGHVGKGELVWSKLSNSEKADFLYKNFTPLITPRTQETLVGKAYNFLPKSVKIKIESEYANKEEYEDGGKVAKVMHEFKEGELETSSGKKVTNPKQAIAIALSEERRMEKGGVFAFKEGDRVKIDYVHDGYVHNGEVGTLIWINESNYYPNGDESVVEKRTQGTIKYDNGDELEVSNIYRKGSGLVSPVLKVEEFAKGGKFTISENSIGFIPMDLEDELIRISKWGNISIRETINILNAIVDSGLTTEEIKPILPKSTMRHMQIRDNKTKDVWSKIEKYYRGNLKGNQYFQVLHDLISEKPRLIDQFRPFRKFQKFEQGGTIPNNAEKEVWQIKDKNGKYWSKSIKDGKDIWNESPDLGYTNTFENAQHILSILNKTGYNDLEIVEYDKDWYKKMEKGGKVGGNSSNEKMYIYSKTKSGEGYSEREFKVYITDEQVRAELMKDIKNYEANDGYVHTEESPNEFSLQDPDDEDSDYISLQIHEVPAGSNVTLLEFKEPNEISVKTFSDYVKAREEMNKRIGKQEWEDEDELDDNTTPNQSGGHTSDGYVWYQIFSKADAQVVNSKSEHVKSINQPIKHNMTQEQIEKLIKGASSTNATAKEISIKKLKEIGLDANGNPIKEEKVEPKKPKKVISKKSEQKSNKSKTAPKKGEKTAEPDCEDLYKQYEKRKAAQKKAKNAPQKTETTKNKEKIEKVEDSIDAQFKAGKLTKAMLQKMYKETKALLQKIEKYLSKL